MKMNKVLVKCKNNDIIKVGDIVYVPKLKQTFIISEIQKPSDDGIIHYIIPINLSTGKSFGLLEKTCPPSKSCKKVHLFGGYDIIVIRDANIEIKENE